MTPNNLHVRILPPRRASLNTRPAYAQRYDPVLREIAEILRDEIVVHFLVGCAEFKYFREHGGFTGEADLGAGAVGGCGEVELG